ncbi:MAG: Brp/Blh family beta-carotene 15,15'-dioxygenase [Rhodoferax sp.]|nr:Brp/Blh family beta-carotene 15,15'-dioxygenase [Rhodoferax sp.]
MSLRCQGLAFSALAWLFLGVSQWLPQVEVQMQLALLAPVILLLGVPHGALDVVFVRQLTRFQSAAGWSLFAIAYLAVAASVVVWWWLAPGSFLMMFLLVSAFHFSGDPDGETPVVFRMLYGGAIIFCPLTLHAAEVSQLFASLAGVSAASMIVAALQWAAWPWVVAAGVAAIAAAKREPTRSIELLSVTALLSFAPPLIGFTIFFCAMHSARHVLRTRVYSNAGTFRHLLCIAAGPMLATAAGVAIAWWLSGGKPLDTRLAQLVFVGLAALTVPHMMVVERVRLTGWVRGRNKSGSTSLNGAIYDR